MFDDDQPCSCVIHSTSVDSDWSADDEVSPEQSNTIPRLIDDTTPAEHSRRVAIASSHGFVYDETTGVKSILSSLTAHEMKFLSDDNMALRHYRAEKGNLDEAIRKIKNTLRWREEFGVDDIKRCFDKNDDLDPDVQKRRNEYAQIISQENATGKIYCRGYDKSGRAVLYLTPGRENSTNELNNMRHLVYHLERGIACTHRKSGRQKVCIVIGYEGFKLSNAPPMSTTKYTLDILQHHYPERMFRAYICDPPFVFRTFWSIIRHFVDPTTLEKIAFCSGGEGQRILERDFDLDTTEKHMCGRREMREFSSEQFLWKIPFEFGFDDYGTDCDL